MNLTTIREDTRFIVFGDETNTEYSNTNLDRNANNWYLLAIARAIKANGDWQVNGEIAYTDIVAGQSEYPLPTDALKLNEVYIYNNLASQRAIQRDPMNISVDPTDYRPGTPEFDLNDNSIFIYVPDSTITARTAGLRIHYQSDLTLLSSGSDIPNLPKLFHKIISIGAAADYLTPYAPQRATQLLNQIEPLMVLLEDFYGGRSTVRRKQLKGRDENYK